MAFEVVTTPAFDERLTSAVDYRVRSVGSSSARRLLDKYDELLLVLESHPLIGTLVYKRNTIPEAEDIRWVLMDNYVVVYHVSSATGVVTLEDLFYKSSNWKSVVKSAFRSRNHPKL